MTGDNRFNEKGAKYGERFREIFGPSPASALGQGKFVATPDGLVPINNAYLRMRSGTVIKVNDGETFEHHRALKNGTNETYITKKYRTI